VKEDRKEQYEEERGQREGRTSSREDFIIPKTRIFAIYF
jgi:hypothetical protein